MTCPTCGQPMNQTRRGATLAKRGPSYWCPAGCERNRTWQAWELETAQDAESERDALMREDDLARQVDTSPF